ncbi:hypothetical protein [Ectobacillus sp. sgz5001026]|uniref:hypothetical protein n=1 Tax=Ectobacillus sp. sgz5001026 TaxID=3242473 RepID=UPI0036D28F98
MNKSGKKVYKFFSAELARWFVPFLASSFFEYEMTCFLYWIGAWKGLAEKVP